MNLDQETGLESILDTNLELTSEPEPKSEALSAPTLADILAAVGQQLQITLAPVVDAIQSMNERQSALETKLAEAQSHSFAPGMEARLGLNAHDPALSVGMRAARSVTLLTRPVEANPAGYNHVVRPLGVTKD